MPFDSELLAVQEACRGRFAVERELGRGGMAIVVLAKDLQLGRSVAMKVLPQTLARQPSLRERFIREARTAAGLSHPNIVPIHTVEEHDDVVFFVMGFVDGETLAQHVARLGPLSGGDATRMVQEVAWALAYAHGRGIVHRDIKPDNILIERATGRALVSDFGIARVADATRALTLDGHVMGTAQFMSPEQAAGEPLDGRSDLYALGVVAFFAATGTLPFEADSVTALLAMQVTRPAPPVASRRPGLPSRLSAAIDRCLEKRADDRFPDAEALADELSAVEVQGATVPPQVRNFQRVAEQSTLMLWLVLVMSLSTAPAIGARWWAALGGPFGAVLAVSIDLLRRGRQLLYDGFDGGDVIRAFLVERDTRESEVEAIFRGEREVRIRRLRRRAAWAAGAAMAVVALLAVVQRGLTGNARLAARIGMGVAYTLGAVAFILAINTTKKAERRSGALVGRLWRSGFTIHFFRAAGIRLRPEDRAPRAHGKPARAELPEAVRRGLPELPALMERFDTAIHALRQREEQVERALAEVGGAGDAPESAPEWTADGDSAASTGPGATTRAVLLHRRLSLVGDLRSALERARAQRTDVIAAHENVRIQLARLRAGVGTASDLAPDVATLRAVLDASTDV